MCESGYITGSDDSDNIKKTRLLISKTASYYNGVDSWKHQTGTGNSVKWIFYGILKNKNMMADCRVYEDGRPYSTAPKCTISLKDNITGQYVTSEGNNTKLVFNADNYKSTEVFKQTLTFIEDVSYWKHFGLVWNGNGYSDKVVYITEKDVTVIYKLKINTNGKVYFTRDTGISSGSNRIGEIIVEHGPYYDSEYGEPRNYTIEYMCSN